MADAKDQSKDAAKDDAKDDEDADASEGADATSAALAEAKAHAKAHDAAKAEANAYAKVRMDGKAKDDEDAKDEEDEQATEDAAMRAAVKAYSDYRAAKAKPKAGDQEDSMGKAAKEDEDEEARTRAKVRAKVRADADSAPDAGSASKLSGSAGLKQPKKDAGMDAARARADAKDDEDEDEESRSKSKAKAKADGYEDEDEDARGKSKAKARADAKDDEDEDEDARAKARADAKDDEDEDEDARAKARADAKDDEDEDEDARAKAKAKAKAVVADLAKGSLNDVMLAKLQEIAALVEGSNKSLALAKLRALTNDGPAFAQPLKDMSSDAQNDDSLAMKGDIDYRTIAASKLDISAPFDRTGVKAGPAGGISPAYDQKSVTADDVREIFAEMLTKFVASDTFVGKLAEIGEAKATAKGADLASKAAIAVLEDELDEAGKVTKALASDVEKLAGEIERIKKLPQPNKGRANGLVAVDKGFVANDPTAEKAASVDDGNSEAPKIADLVSKAANGDMNAQRELAKIFAPKAQGEVVNPTAVYAATVGDKLR